MHTHGVLYDSNIYCNGCCIFKTFISKRLITLHGCKSSLNEMRKFSVVEPSGQSILENVGHSHGRTKKTLWNRVKNRLHEIIIGKNIDAERFVMGQMLVEKQTAFHSSPDPDNLFHTLLKGNFEEFKKHCLDVSTAVDTRDPVGACVFHIAYLYGIYDSGRWLVENYPTECLNTYGVPAGYTDDKDFLPYTGENILHMVIMQRSLEQAQFILKTYEEKGEEDLRNLLCAQAVGHFFQPGGDVGKYFGAFPLLFAVCSNGTHMVDLILKYAARINKNKEKTPFSLFVDGHGNNALHMCVLHNLQDMLLHIKSLCKDEFYNLMKQENHDGLSPFTLAATENSSMFQFLLDQRKQPLWTYGPVTRFKVDLEGLDYPHDAHISTDLLENEEDSSPMSMNRGTLDRVHSLIQAYNPVHRITKGEDCSAIELICIRNKLHKFEIPVIRQIVETKWTRIGYPQFKYRFLFYLVVTLMLMLIVCLVEYQHGDTFLPWLTWCLFVAVFVILTYKFLNEIAEMYSLGLAYWGIGADLGVRGAAQLDNICSTVEFLTFATACFLKVLQYVNAVSTESTEQTVRALLSITVLTSWIYLYFFLLGFEITGVFVVIVADILSSDMPKFMALFVVVLFGFGSSFALLHGTEIGVGLTGGVHNLIDYIWTLLVYTITGGNEGERYFPYGHGRAPRWFYVGLVMLYNLCIVFLMLNLLVAMMSKTYEELSQTSNLIVLREKYNIMCSFERSYTPHQRTKARKMYSITQKEVTENESLNYRFFFQLEETNENWITTGNLSDPKPDKIDSDDMVKKIN